MSRLYCRILREQRRKEKLQAAKAAQAEANGTFEVPDIDDLPPPDIELE